MYIVSHHSKDSNCFELLSYRYFYYPFVNNKFIASNWRQLIYVFVPNENFLRHHTKMLYRIAWIKVCIKSLCFFIHMFLRTTREQQTEEQQILHTNCVNNIALYACPHANSNRLLLMPLRNGIIWKFIVNDLLHTRNKNTAIWHSHTAYPPTNIAYD